MTHLNSQRDAQRWFFSAVTADIRATQTHLHSLVWSCSKLCCEQPVLPKLNDQKQIYRVATATSKHMCSCPRRRLSPTLHHIVDGFLELFQHHPAK